MKLRVVVSDDPFQREPVEVALQEDITLSGLRAVLQERLQGHPAADEMRIIVQGRALGLSRGAEKLKDVLADFNQSSDAQDPVIHLVVPLSAWKELPTKTDSPSKAGPSTPPQPPASPQASTPAPKAEPASHPRKEWPEPWNTAVQNYKALSAIEAYMVKGRLASSKAYLTHRLHVCLKELNIVSHSFEATAYLLKVHSEDRSAYDAKFESYIGSLVTELGLDSLVTTFVEMAPTDVEESLAKLHPLSRDALGSKQECLARFQTARRYQALLSIIESLDLLLLSEVLTDFPRSHIINFNLASAKESDPFQARTRSTLMPARFSQYFPPPRPNMGLANAAAPGNAFLPMPVRAPANGQGLPGLPVVQAQQPRPRANALAVVINLDELRRTLVPLFWLAFKLSFLLYIFGRHASTKKRLVLIGMALGWVIWEGWTMRARRAAQGRRIQQQVIQQQQQQGAAPRPGQPAPNGAAWEGLAPGVILQRARRAQPAPNGRPFIEAGQQNRRHHAHHTPRNLVSPNYWINTLASVGLAAEARRMGLTGVRRSSSGELRVSRHPSPVEPQTAWQRATQTFVVGVVLFVGTLIPEVERKRKKAIEKRNKLAKQVREMRAQMAEEEREKQTQAAALAAAQSTDPPSSSSQPTNAPAPTLAPLNTATPNALVPALASPGPRPEDQIEPEFELPDIDPDGDIGTPPLPVHLDEGEGEAPGAPPPTDLRAHARLLNRQIEDMAREQADRHDGGGGEPPRVEGAEAERVVVDDLAQDEARPQEPIDEVGVVLF